MRHAALSLFASVLVVAAPAHAGGMSPSLTDCSLPLIGQVSGAYACSQVTPLDGKLNDKPGLINSLGFFGFSDWLFDGKWEGGSDSSGLFDFSGGSLAGSYTYTGGSDIADLLMLFKSGAGTNLVGYLVAAANGSYASPFLPGAFQVRNTKDISHISVYYRPGRPSTSGGSTGGEPGTGTAGGPPEEAFLLTGAIPAGDPASETDPPLWEPLPGPGGSWTDVPSGGHNPVPAPGVLPLMAAGLLGLTLARRQC